jgi:flagellar hook-associated protein 3 FlgL
MRVNPNPTPDLLIALAQSRQDEQEALLQLASGRRVSTPSDDPAAAAVLVGNRTRTAGVQQFLRSIASQRTQLQSADSALNSVVLVLQRAITVGIQGGNGTLSDSDRNAVAQELLGLQGQVLSLANTSIEGIYLFAGTESQTAPYVADTNSPSGVGYQGNSNVNVLSIGAGFSIPVNVPGAQIFNGAGADVFQALSDLAQAVRNNSGVDSAVSDVRKALDTVSARRVFYGNTMQQMSTQETFLNSEKLELAQEENSLAAADMAASASQLLNAQSARSAALQAAGNMLRNSLFDYLK